MNFEKPTSTEQYLGQLWQLIAAHTHLWSAIVVSDTINNTKYFQNVNKAELERYVDKTAIEMFDVPLNKEFAIEARTAIRTTKEYLAQIND